ncbi:somatomedin-B and thrombospondin type-1 domain-containing protein-like [Stegodyphus dumicola]|uniref:somatomedin-B and thrombospondin type-1 domain-containing protein-like n=1 Tax=Stegodyphus dumicola TaxID=202533 RepID=UPI0015B2C9C7|nr:somatomedin-B and thrombospondin type-1 domain-containing protein-like [Stegodyphus dumicola]
MKVHLLILVALAVCTGARRRGSCREAGLCCPGRDSNCVVPRNSVLFNTITSDEHGKPCYCDHACLRVGDCCEDFQEYCEARNCEVSGWGPWSECNTDCGTGVMTRERHVIRPAANGGEICPELSQKRSCYGTRCEENIHVKANRETAMILSATYSTIRHLNESKDIRNNLRIKYRKDPEVEKSKEYCIVFEVTKVKKHCESLGNELSPKLEKGSKVCVVCETAAMRKHLGYRCQGHGVDHKTTRFTFLAFPQCHGRWKRLEMTDKCTCNENGDADFIFV